MRVLRALVLALSVMTVCVPVSAEDLMDVYALALASDPQLRAANARRNAEIESRPQARAGLLPDLSLSADVNQNNIRRDGDRSQFGTSGYSFRLAQPVYDRAAWHRFGQSKHIVDRANSDYEFQRQDLILRTAEGYFAFLDAEVEVGFRGADKRALEGQLEQAQRRFDVGLVTITDVLDAQARLDRAVADEIIAVNTRSDASEALRELTGRYIDRVSYLKPDMPLMTAEPHDVEQWVNEAVDTNPLIVAAKADVEAASEEIEVQRSGHFPTVDAVATYLDDRSGAPNAADLDGGTIGLQFNMSLYAGGAVNSRTRQAAERRQATFERLDEVTRRVERETRDAFRNLDATISFVRAVDQTVKSGRSAFEATTAGYEVGTRTIVDVLNAQRDLLRQQRDYEVARNAHLINRLRLKLAAGNLVIEDLEEINPYLQPKPYTWLEPVGTNLETLVDTQIGQ